MEATSEPKAAARSGDALDVLSLVNVRDATFYLNQVRALSEQGVNCKTLSVPGEIDGSDPDANRSPLDYLRFFPSVFDEVSEGYDVVHANFGLTGPHALAQQQCPVVLTLWGSDVFGEFGWLSKLCARRADAVIVMSERMGDPLPSEYTVIPHGIDFEMFHPIPQQRARAELGWDQSAHQVLFPSPTAREEKNFPRAKRVVERVRSEVDGEVVLQTPDGQVPHERMPLVMNAADVLLLTSTHEGFPNTVKEALACNLPVVSTDVGGVPDRLAAVEPSAVGRTDEELVDAVVSVFRSGERSNGRETVQDLSLDRMAERIREVYERVLDEA
jgi:glycosyltransferase involved in cell wall biosynthesis